MYKVPPCAGLSVEPVARQINR